MCYVVTTGDLVSKLKGYEDEEEEEDEDDMMAVQGSDGQQYVVLEVIQLADNQGTDQVSNTFCGINSQCVIINGCVKKIRRNYSIG